MTPTSNPPLINSVFLKRLVCYLMPFFAPLTNSYDEAEADIIETLASYGAQTRPQLLNAVQIIALGMSGLELLAQAKADTTLSAPQQIRLRGCANNLNRSAQQAEKALAERLKCDRASQPDPQPEPEPADDTLPLPTEEILRRIDAKVAAARKAAQPARGKGSAMFNTLFDEATALAQSATPHRPPTPNPRT